MRRLRTAVVVLGLLIGTFASVPQAQSVVNAAILDFFRVLRVGGTWSGTSLTFSTLGVVSNGYVNFGSLRGTSGYGLRDNAGAIEVKNSAGSWAAIGTGGNPLATYLVKTASGAPANAQIMGLLGTGLVLNTTTTGVQSIFAGTSCTAQFPRSLSAAGVATCAKVAMATDMSGTMAAAQFPALTGDVTTVAGALATTLASTGVGAGSVGSATAIPVVTFDAKGRATVKTTATPQLTLTSTYFSSLSGANLTALPAASLTGTIAAARMPALTGDVTSTVNTVTTVVASIGGKIVTLGGALTFSGANAVTFTTTGATSVTLPTSGTLLSGTVTSLTSLAAVGTLTTGVWNATPITPTYGGTGLATLTQHGVLVGQATSNVSVLAGCTNGIVHWASAIVDPTCNASPVLTSVGLTGSQILGGTGLAAGATTQTSLTKAVTGIADAVATPVLTVTIPNTANSAVVHVRLIGSLGAGGAIGANECSSVIEGNVTVARTAGVATVATASTAGLTSNSCVAGAATITFAYSVSAVSGATGATQTFAVNVTITKGSGSSANHTAVVFAEVLNANAAGVTVA